MIHSVIRYPAVICGFIFLCAVMTALSVCAQKPEYYTRGMLVETPKSTLGSLPPEKVTLKADIIDPKSLKTKTVSFPRIKKLSSDADSPFCSEWTSAIRMINNKVISDSYKTGTSIVNLAFADTLPVTLYAAYKKETLPLRTVMLYRPQIDTYTAKDGFPLTHPVGPYSQIMLKGRYFGKSAPRVWLEYRSQKTGEIKRLSCQPMRPLLMHDVMNRAEKQCTDALTGESKIVVRFPKRFPADFQHSNKVVLVMDNAISADSVYIHTCPELPDTALHIPPSADIMDQSLSDTKKGTVLIPVLTATDAFGRLLVRDEGGAYLSLEKPETTVPNVATFSISKGNLIVTFKPNTGGVTTHINVIVVDKASKRSRELSFLVPSNRPLKYPESMEMFRNDFRALNITSCGGFAALCDNGTFYFAEGFGAHSLADSTAVSDQTLFGMGTASEIFSASACVWMAMRGKMNLDKKISTYLDNFKLADKRYTKLTPTMLMSHTSGIAGGYAPYSETRDPIIPGLYNLAAYENLRTSKMFAKDPEYTIMPSTDNYVLLERVIDAVARKKFKQSFAEFVIDRMFIKELKMKNTFLPHHNGLPLNRVAHSYARINGADHTLSTLYSNNPAGTGFYSSPVDLCQFAKAHMPKAAEKQSLFGFEWTVSGFDGLIKKKWVKKMEKNYAASTKLWPAEDKRNGFGLGWDAGETPLLKTLDVTCSVKRGVSSDYATVLLSSRPARISIALCVTQPVDIRAVESIAERFMVNVLCEKNKIKDGKFPKEIETPAAPAKAISGTTAAAHTGIFANNSDIYFLMPVDMQAPLKMRLMKRLDHTWKEMGVYTWRANSHYATDDEWTPEFYAKAKDNLKYLIEYTVDSTMKISDNHSVWLQRPPLVKVAEPAVALWHLRMDDVWLRVNDHYMNADVNSSPFFTFSNPDTGVFQDARIPGYMILGNGKKQTLLQISGLNTLIPNLIIPGAYGTGMPTVTAETRGTEEWMKIDELITRPASAVPTLSPGYSARITIDQNMLWQWFKISDNTTEIHIDTVSDPAHRWMIYDKNFNLIEDSLHIPGGAPYAVQNPKAAGGYLVLKGNAGVAFSIRGL